MRVLNWVFLSALALLMALTSGADSIVLLQGYWERMQPCLSTNTADCPAGVKINPKLQHVQLLQRNGEWAQVGIDGQKYWVFTEGLRRVRSTEVTASAPAPTSQPPVTQNGNAPSATTSASPAVAVPPAASAPVSPAVSPIGQRYNALVDNTAIRNMPGANIAGSQIVDSVNREATLEIVSVFKDSQGGDWYKVRYNSNGRVALGYIDETRVRPLSDSATEAAASTATGACPDGSCAQAAVNSNIVHVAVVTAPANDGRGHNLGSAFHASCQAYISAKGIGPYGVAAIQAARQVAPQCFYMSNVFDNLCPGYNRLSTAQKDSFIALVFASIANSESSCNPNAKAAASNGLADGLYQLEYSFWARLRAGRNSRWCQTTGPADTNSLSFQSQCSVSTIEDTICGNGRQLNNGNGYWQELRGNGTISRNIRRTATKWGLCK